MLKYERNFVGRERDLTRLEEFLSDAAIKVICIFGEPGIGKTALANCVLERANISRFKHQPPLRHQVFRPGSMEGIWGVGLEDWLVSSLAKEVLPSIPRNTTRPELVDAILTSIGKESVFLLLDNAETLDQEWLQDFVGQWLDRANDSLLLLTTTRDPSLDSRVSKIISGYKLYPLSGFSDEETEAILKLLGEELNKRFKENPLLKASKKLGNSPQRLLYLRWLAPQDKDGLDHLVADLSNGNDTPPKNLVETIQSRIKGPLNHFLALGHVRTIEIEDNLLAWLWNNLGGGSAQTFVDVRDQLVADGVLTRVRQPNKEVLRIHPSVHIQLENHLERNIGPVHVIHVDYYISEYYREQFEKEKGAPDMSLLGRYVYHAILGMNFGNAINYLLDPERLRRFHHMGLAMVLHPVLSMAGSYITDRMDKIKFELNKLRTNPVEGENNEKIDRLLLEQQELPHFLLSVNIELAHCDNDLSNHEDCLKHLEQAEEILRGFSDNETVVIPFRQRINYLKGISFSDLGKSLECVQAYLSVVQDGDRLKKWDERVILALGYLGFEMRFHDFRHAQILGQKAIDLAEKSHETSLIAKCKCSLAETLFFENKIEDAANYFKEAENLCRKEAAGRSDRRELGRVLIHQSMVHIVRGEYKEANEMINEGEQINFQSGDRRRLATSKTLCSIILWREKHFKEAKKLLEEAIKQHYNIKDWRNLVNETLSYAFMLGYHSQKEAIKAASSSSHSNKIWAKVLSDTSAEKPLDFFGEYWASRFRPRLLE